MKIVVLNGSPKSDTSFTMQSVHYIENKFPQHTFKIHDVAKKIKLIEKNNHYFQEIMNDVKNADGILWAFSVHFFLVTSQYKRFIELVFENKATSFFKGKHTSLLLTSIHFFDHTAINYMNGVCDDLGMKYLGSFSSDMYDLLKKDERKRLISFADNFFTSIAQNRYPVRNYREVAHEKYKYTASKNANLLDNQNKKIIVITDLYDKTSNLGQMIDRFRACFKNSIEVIDLSSINISGGCLGCLQCGPNNVCSYMNSDDFVHLYESKVKTADAIIFAGEIKDRYLSSTWKMFFDRSFYNTHIPFLVKKQIAFIISGPFGKIPNIREIFEGYAEWQQANLVDFITDEYDKPEIIDLLIADLAKQITRFLDTNYVRPRTFLGIGGMKIFRDNTLGRFRFVLQGNHRFFKKNKLYDFSHKQFKYRMVNTLMMTITRIPKVREIFCRQIDRNMVKPLKKIIKENK